MNPSNGYLSNEPHDRKNATAACLAGQDIPFDWNSVSTLAGKVSGRNSVDAPVLGSYVSSGMIMEGMGGIAKIPGNDDEMNGKAVIESSAYVMFVVQSLVFLTYWWWAQLVPVSLIYPILFLPLVVGLALNILTLRQDKKKVLVWCITAYYAVYGSLLAWDWMK